MGLVTLTFDLSTL